MIKENYKCETPILFLIFNRLDTTLTVFEAIKNVRPAKLYIASDGFRESKRGEKELVKRVRDSVMSQIDWDCEVKTLFRESNLGCGLAVSGALDWFFNNEEYGIILEDDCLPSTSFFPFVEEMLTKYADNESVGSIGGYNLFGNLNENKSSYSFITMPIIWGWATWKRTWDLYKYNISGYSKSEISNVVNNVAKSQNTRRYFFSGIYETSIGNIDTWDFQLVFKLFLDKKLIIVPDKNLIENIGFGDGATHTSDGNSDFGKVKGDELEFPLYHEKEIKVNKELVDLFEKNMYRLTNWMSFRIKAKRFILKVIN